MQAMLGRLASHLGGKQEEVTVNGTVYKLAGVIGEGRFSKVYKAEYGRGWVAVKRLVGAWEEEVLRARKELGLLRKLCRVPNIVGLVDGEVGEDTVTVVMELCGGSAMQLLRKYHEGEDDVPSHVVFGVLTSCCKALGALHGLSPPVAHRDVKLENILSTSKPTVWKLCDFGSSSTEALRCTTPEQVAKAQEDIDTHTTLAYRAPEITDLWRRERADQQVDIWSVGVMFYVLSFKEFPFEEQPLAILNKKPQIPDYADPEVGKLIMETLSKNPSHRPDAWQLHNKLGTLSKDPFKEIKRPKGWAEQPLAPWCAGKMEIVTDDGPLVCPPTPELLTDGSEFGAPEGEEDMPVVDASDEVPHVHMVVGYDDEGDKVERSWGAKLKDWAEVQGVPGKALTLLHSDTPHAWVIKLTDSSFRHLKTLYLNKILAHCDLVGLGPVFHYVSLRPFLHDAVVAYKVLCLVHHILRESPVTLHRQLYSSHRAILTDLQQRWTMGEDDRLPSLPSVIVKYTDYLRKRLARFIKTGSLEAETHEESAQLGELFNCGVDLAMDLAPPLRNKAEMYNSCLVMMVLDLDEINSFLKVAPLKGGRFGMIEIEVAESRKSFTRFTELIERHMPELKLLNVIAEEDEEDQGEHVFDVEEVYLNLPYERSVQVDMNEVSRRKGNEVCFDCRERPSAWASAGIGVFLCGCCYTYHDVVPFSRVKSILLDRWTPEQVSFLARVGNVKALPIWLGNPPPAIPDPEAEPEVYQSYVYDKYMRRAFLKIPVPAFETAAQSLFSPQGGNVTSEVPLKSQPSADLDSLFVLPAAKEASANSLFPPQESGAGSGNLDMLFSATSFPPVPSAGSSLPPGSGNLDALFGAPDVQLTTTVSPSNDMFTTTQGTTVPASGATNLFPPPTDFAQPAQPSQSKLSIDDLFS